MRWIVLVLFAVTLSTWARAPKEVHIDDKNIVNLPDTSLGHFQFEVRPVPDRASEPFFFNAYAICKDLRKEGPHALKPGKVSLMKSEDGREGVTICFILSHDFDKDQMTLRFSYVRDNAEEPAGNCNQQFDSQIYDLKLICAAWAP